MTGLSVLLVDGDLPSRAGRAGWLRKAGFKLHLAQNIAHGKQVTAHALPDVVVAAESVAQRQGAAGMMALLDDPDAKLIPLLVIGRPASDGELADALAVGVADFLDADCPEALFVAKIKAYASRRRRERVLEASLSRQVASTAAVAAEWRHSLSSVALVEARERNILAGRLHDAPLQRLALASISLDLLDPADIGQDVQKHLETAKSQIALAIKEMRFMLFDLSPASLYRSGLEIALRELAHHANDIGETQFLYSSEGDVRFDNELLKINLYRAASELVNNVLKHAKSNHAEIRLRVIEESVELEVWDDGIGPKEPKPEGFGLRSIRERLHCIGGNLTLDHRRGGFCATIRIPINPKTVNPDV